MNQRQISFIGAGNMANSLIRGLLAKDVPAQNIAATDIDSDKLSQLASECGIRTGDTSSVASEADVIVLAVKPQVMASVCEALRPLIGKKDCLIISIAAGIPVSSLASWLGDNRAIVRCMPNTPSLVGEGATGLFANARCSEQHQQLAGDIMAAVGIACWLDQEQDIDAVTALSGSGPAYFFLMMEAMEKAGTAMGLTAETARQLAIQTALGAGKLAANSDVPPDELRRRVTSPGGTTEQALLSFQRDGFESIVETAMKAAQQRAAELAK
ncbi:MAG TPA: pyrroline-5-carboxylate reductase [Pseudohongiella sp.]|nr:pyrroline-5-carboxylate reductase [Pseudohongiella sp.]HBX36066.1 pyrroline-5-carboxylate reductase [Pseudohongiella sp.]